MPEEILPSEINEFIFNQDTVDRVINDLMTNGLRDSSGNRLGRRSSLRRTRTMPSLLSTGSTPSTRSTGTFCRRVVCDDDYVQD